VHNKQPHFAVTYIALFIYFLVLRPNTRIWPPRFWGL